MKFSRLTLVKDFDISKYEIVLLIKYRPNRLSIIVFSILALAVVIILTALILTARNAYSLYETKITAPVKGIYQEPLLILEE